MKFGILFSVDSFTDTEEVGYIKLCFSPQKEDEKESSGLHHFDLSFSNV